MNVEPASKKVVLSKEEYSKHHHGGYLVQKRFLMKLPVSAFSGMTNLF
jgi:hypothetical protein